MGTVASPVSIREQALEAIAAIVGPSDSTRRLGEIGGAVFVDLLSALERRFDIGIDADEVLPNGTVGMLSHLVELRALAAQAAAHAGKVYYWDDERAARDLPHYSPRPRLVEVIRDARAEAALAPPPWPLTYPEPAPPRIPLAVPSDAAWARAERLHARERARRARCLWLALACAVAAVACAVAAVASAAVWLRLAGFA